MALFSRYHPEEVYPRGNRFTILIEPVPSHFSRAGRHRGVDEPLYDTSAEIVDVYHYPRACRATPFQPARYIESYHGRWIERVGEVLIEMGGIFDRPAVISSDRTADHVSAPRYYLVEVARIICYAADRDRVSVPCHMAKCELNRLAVRLERRGKYRYRV